jgi:hypothetical protein
MSPPYDSVIIVKERIQMPLMTIPSKKVFACDNGCGAEFDFDPGSDLLTQMSSPDERYTMLVCPQCVFDEALVEWSVDFDTDPR